MLKLYVPKIADLWFKKILKEDSATMDYNAGYDVNYKGYDYFKGTIQTDIKELENVWYKKWINNWPETYYAYIKLKQEYIGEIYAKYDKNNNAYEIGIVIKGSYRGRGYATEAVKLLCNKLKGMSASVVFHKIPKSRIAAIRADINNGFVLKYDNIVGQKKFGKKEQIVYLEKIL